MWSGNDHERVVTIAKTQILAMSFASLFTACEYVHVKYSSRYTQFDTHGGGIILPFLASLMEEDSNVVLASLITLSGSNPVISLLSLKKSAEINCNHYVADEFQFPGYDVETVAVSNIVATHAKKSRKVRREVALDVPGRVITRLKGTSYESMEGFALEWIRLNVKVDEKDVPDDGFLDTYSLQFILQRDAGRTHDTSVVDQGVTSAWGILKGQLTRAQYTEPIAIAKMLGLSCETLVWRVLF